MEIAGQNSRLMIQDSFQTAYSRTSLNIDATVSAEFFSDRVDVILRRETKRVSALKEIYPRDWGSIFTRAAPDFNVLSPATDVIAILNSDAETLKLIDLSVVIEVHNFAVLVLRYMCNEELKKAQRVNVRDGLTIPRDWQTHFENLLACNSPVLLLAVLQHAFSGNPLAGEIYEWDN